MAPETPLEQALDRIVDEGARVEPDLAAFRRMMNQAQAAAPRPGFSWAPVWVGIAAALLAILGLVWYQVRQRQLATRALLASHNEKMVMQAVPGREPLTDQEKALIKKLEQDPTALANEPMPDTPPPKPAPKPTQKGNGPGRG